MSDLAARQMAFMHAILDEDAPLPAGWGNSQAAGMSVYRGNYRSALIGALESTFERTARYVGAGPFRQAAINHAIARPPEGWTIDEAGRGFDETCAALFAENPEVAELAWLEWTMLQAVTAPDCDPIGPVAFAEATAEFGDSEWIGLRLAFQQRAQARLVKTHLTRLWKALAKDLAGQRPAPRLAAPRGCIVSREDERPTFQLVDRDTARGFALMHDGGTYGELVVLLAGETAAPDAMRAAAMRAGAMIGEWLKDGLVVGIDA